MREEDTISKYEKEVWSMCTLANTDNTHFRACAHDTQLRQLRVETHSDGIFHDFALRAAPVASHTFEGSACPRAFRREQADTRRRLRDVTSMWMRTRLKCVLLFADGRSAHVFMRTRPNVSFIHRHIHRHKHTFTCSRECYSPHINLMYHETARQWPPFRRSKKTPASPPPEPALSQNKHPVTQTPF